MVHFYRVITAHFKADDALSAAIFHRVTRQRSRRHHRCRHPSRRATHCRSASPPALRPAPPLSDTATGAACRQIGRRTQLNIHTRRPQAGRHRGRVAPATADNPVIVPITLRGHHTARESMCSPWDTSCTGFHSGRPQEPLFKPLSRRQAPRVQPATPLSAGRLSPLTSPFTPTRDHHVSDSARR